MSHGHIALSEGRKSTLSLLQIVACTSLFEALCLVLIENLYTFYRKLLGRAFYSNDKRKEAVS